MGAARAPINADRSLTVDSDSGGLENGVIEMVTPDKLFPATRGADVVWIRAKPK